MCFFLRCSLTCIQTISFKKALEGVQQGIRINNELKNVTRYTADIVIISDNIKSLEILLNHVSEKISFQLAIIQYSTFYLNQHQIERDGAGLHNHGLKKRTKSSNI